MLSIKQRKSGDYRRIYRCNFFKSETDIWLKAERRKTLDEIDAAADEALAVK